MRFRKSGSKWKKLNEITLQNYQSENSVSCYDYANTLVVTRKHIYVAMISSHRIKRYDMSGNNVTEIGSYDPGFSLPSICGIDKNNTLLIANYNNYRLDWLTDNGTIITLQGYGAPWHAAFQNDTTMWVIDNSNKLHKYSCN